MSNTENKIQFEWGGRKYKKSDFVEEWEICRSNEAERACVPALRSVLFNPTYETFYVVKSCDGDFFVSWETYHREQGPEPDAGDYVTQAEYNAAWGEWNNFLTIQPPTLHFLPITREQAFKLMVNVWLPKEFHADAGL